MISYQKNFQLYLWDFHYNIKFLFRQFKNKKEFFTNKSIFKIIQFGIPNFKEDLYFHSPNISTHALELRIF